MSSVSTETEFTSSLKKDENIYLTKDRQFLYFNDLQEVITITTRAKFASN